MNSGSWKVYETLYWVNTKVRIIIQPDKNYITKSGDYPVKFDVVSENERQSFTVNLKVTA